MKKISCGGSHAALLTAQGRLFMMGRGREGQLGRFFNN
jgi:alpha-tubulin suppressor-like RCC1 family protein